MALFSRYQSSLDLHKEIGALRKEVAALGKAASRQGSSAYRDTRDQASDLYAELAERVSDALPVIRRRAHDFEETIRANPTRTVAVVGLVALTVAAAAILGSRRR
ncbi:MAG: hypothetical protein KL801_18665 [Mesorhizobium sp.]|nr:hypothetical protein [Mesorhizobium sp.]